MNRKPLFFLLLLFILLAAAACSAVGSSEPAGGVVSQPAAPQPAAGQPTPAIEPAASATHAPTVEPVVKPAEEPAPEPAVEPEMEVDPFTLARQIIEQVDLTPPEGRRIEPCEGEAAVLCVHDGDKNAGYVELLIFPLTSYPEGHPVHLVANNLPADSAAYTADQATAVQQALTTLAEEHLDVIAADRAITYPNNTFTRLPIEPAKMGALPALTFGFVHTNEAGEVLERYLNVAAFDRHFIYWLGINYDPGNVSTFVSEPFLTQFAPFFLEIAASLPLPLKQSQN